MGKLDAMFDQKVDPQQYADVEDMAGLIGQYVHGNEPSHHLAYLYDYDGQPWRPQERRRAPSGAKRWTLWLPYPSAA